MTPLHVAVLFAVGVVSGAMNTVGGAGGAVAIPVLTGMLGNPVMGLATFRIGVVAQSAIGLEGFLREDGKLVVSWRQLGMFLGVGLVGGSLGALIATQVAPALYGLMVALGLTAIVALLARNWWLGRAAARDGEAGPRASAPPWRRPVQIAGLLAASAYGGFLHVGISFILLLVLQRGCGLKTVHALGVRSAIMLALNAIALAWMGLAGMVAWRHGVILAVGSVVGALAAVRLAVAQRERTLQTIILAMATLALLGVIVALVKSRG